MAKQKTHKTPAIETVNIGAAAVDIGSREHMAAVNPDATDDPVRAFGTFTHDLHNLADWFKTHGVTSVAMESTGVYWIPAYEIPAPTVEVGRVCGGPYPTHAESADGNEPATASRCV